VTSGQSPKEIREGEVIDSFLAHLAAVGVEANLLEHPDRLDPTQRRYRAVTTDAIIGTGTGSTWSCDVMALAADASHAEMPMILHDDLEPLAQQHGVDIVVTGALPDRREVKALTAAVRQALTAGDDGPVQQGGGEASWQASDAPGVVHLLIELPSPSALLSDQLASTIRDPLTKKATHQAAPAKLAGLSTAVLLDGIGATSLRQGTHWLHDSADTVARAVELVLSEVDHQLDSIIYLHRDGSWHLVHGQPVG
jgi:hypothetical protein